MGRFLDTFRVGGFPSLRPLSLGPATAPDQGVRPAGEQPPPLDTPSPDTVSMSMVGHGRDRHGVPSPLDLLDITDERLRHFRQAWDVWRKGAPMAARRDIDPTLVPQVLANLFLIDVDADRRLHASLVGEEVKKIMGSVDGLSDPRSTPQDVYTGPYRIEHRLSFQRMIDERLGLHVHGLIHVNDFCGILGEELIFPVVDPTGQRVVGLIGGMVRQGMTAHEFALDRRHGPSFEFFRLD